MTEGVTYTKLLEAEEYAKSVDGTVVSVDRDGDGVAEGYNVIVPVQPGDEAIQPNTEDVDQVLLSK